MRCNWLPIVTGLCISWLPACALPLSPVSRLPELPDVPGASNSQARTSDRAPVELSRKSPAVEDPIIEPVRPALAQAGPDLIPEPRGVTDALKPIPAAQPTVQSTVAETAPEAKRQPVEEVPVLQALRCYLDNRPAEAIASLGSYDKSSQDLLLYLLPLTARLCEGKLERCDSREAAALVKQFDRVAATLRPRATLNIKKMCFCSVVEGYGKYALLPDGKTFLPGENARIYVELENLTDQPQGNAYSIHLLSSIDIKDFKERCWMRHIFEDERDLSRSERHDFSRWYRFQVPEDLSPGFYTLYLTIIDEPTGRKVVQTLDFRVMTTSGKGQS
ncbi:MAG TPA: hypothetical protein VKU02_13630 [Gemmataceae bacterium]|nr:hypothetical protein [Gemmataceae bacterium]